MQKSIVKYLVSPDTAAPLDLSVKHESDGQVLAGDLVNAQNPGEHYPILNGVPRFVQADLLPAEQRETVDTFSFKWTQIPDYASDEESKHYREAWYYERFGFQNGDADVRKFLEGAEHILEAGTGTGVDTDMLARNSDGLVFGIDISTAIDTAFQRFRGNDRVALLQADIGRLPFRPAFFDVISCDQVLHHTPNPPENFAKLVKLLKPGGKFLLYVYKVKGPLREYADDYLRKIYIDSPIDDAIDFSARMARLGRNLSHLHAKVEVEDDIPELGIKSGTYDVQRLIYDHILKCYWNDRFDADTNTMVNFDWYRPRHAFRYTPDQVKAWASESGMNITHMDVSPSGISVVMVKHE